MNTWEEKNPQNCKMVFFTFWKFYYDKGNGVLLNHLVSEF